MKVDLGNVVSELSDDTMQRHGWSFFRGAQEFALVGDDYRELRKLVDRLLRKRAFAAGFSEYFLQQTIVQWCRMEDDEGSLSDHLLATCTSAWDNHLFLVPFANLEIETDFAIGNVRVVTVDPAIFTRARTYARECNPDKPSAGEGIQKLADQFANHAAAEIAVAGEPRYARDRAMTIAHDVAAVLRFLSPARLSIRLHSPIQPMGFSTLRSENILSVENERLKRFDRAYLHIALSHWKLGIAEIDSLKSGRNSNIAVLFDGREDTPFAARARRAFFAYCRALGEYDVAERLVATIGALEAFLLQGEVEGLQSKVAERLAFLTATNVDDRLKVVADYRSAYRLRSRAVHQLQGVDDEEAAERLNLHALVFFQKIVRGLSIFDDPDSFFMLLDRIKFSGSIRASDPPEDGADELSDRAVHE